MGQPLLPCFRSCRLQGCYPYSPSATSTTCLANDLKQAYSYKEAAYLTYTYQFPVSEFHVLFQDFKNSNCIQFISLLYSGLKYHAFLFNRMYLDSGKKSLEILQTLKPMVGQSYLFNIVACGTVHLIFVSAQVPLLWGWILPYTGLKMFTDCQNMQISTASKTQGKQEKSERLKEKYGIKRKKKYSYLGGCTQPLQ